MQNSIVVLWWAGAAMALGQVGPVDPTAGWGEWVQFGLGGVIAIYLIMWEIPKQREKDREYTERMREKDRELITMIVNKHDARQEALLTQYREEMQEERAQHMKEQEALLRGLGCRLPPGGASPSPR